MRNLSLPIILILGGMAWLAHNMGYLPDLRSLGALILVIAGVAVLALEGITRNSVISGPMLIAGGLAWMAREKDLVDWRILAPALVIVLGICILISRLPGIPNSRGEVSEKNRP